MSDLLRLRVDDSIIALMASRKFSLAVTIAPDGLMLLGLSPEGKLHIELRYISHAFAVAFDRGRLAVSNRQEIVVYGNSPRLAPQHPEHPGLYDAFFTPLVSFFTGDCAVHDIAITRQGLVVANTRFSTVCLIDGQYNFNPIWQPKFISAPMPEDRCHLNGLVVTDDQVRYVTAFGSSDQKGGWRAEKECRGVLIDVVCDSILLGNLSMPHSPRLFDGRLFVLESGFGAVLEIDPNNGEKRCLARLPGLTRGLCADKDILFVGLSHRRSSKLDWKLPIDSLDTPLKAGVAAVDANTGNVIGMIEILNDLREVFDVKLLPNIACPGIADINNPDGFFLLDSSAGSYWLTTAPADRGGAAAGTQSKPETA
jgi:uncharacterized protein (TIGR03032 family)